MLNALRPLLVFAAFALALPVSAEDAREQKAEVGERIRQVEREGGQVLRAERMQRGGEDVYRIKVLTPEGRVRVLHDRRQPEASPPRNERRSIDRRSLMLRDHARRTAQSQRAAEANNDVREPDTRLPRTQDD